MKTILRYDKLPTRMTKLKISGISKYIIGKGIEYKRKKKKTDINYGV